MKFKFLAIAALTFLWLTITTIAFAQQQGTDVNNPNPNGNSWAWRVRGYSTGHPNGSSVYDDENFPDPSTGQGWNCERKFLFAHPVNQPVTLQIASFAAIPPATDCRIRIYPFGNPSNVIYQTVVPWTDITFSFPAIGDYVIEYAHHPYGSSAYTIDIKAEMQIVVPIEKVWVELPEICADNYPAGMDYHFKLKTFPAIKDIMYPAGYFYFSPSPGAACEQGDRYQMEIWNDRSDLTISRHGMRLPEIPAQVYTNWIKLAGFNYMASRYQGPNPYYPEAFDDFFIPYSVLAPYLQQGNGTNPVIRFDVFDGVTTHTVEAPILITGTGDPATSFHLPDYTVGATGTANEVWTPTSNPATALYGNGSTQPVLRIQNTLTIPAGTKLTIKDMTVEMGPTGHIIVEANDPAVGNTGGYLKVDHSTLTAYRGCGNEANTWWGAFVHGHSNKSQDDILVNTPKSPAQGMMEMNSGQISYANWAVQLYNPFQGAEGDYYSSAGGVFNAVNSSFFNNRRAINYMPYDYHDPLNPGLLRRYRSNLTDCYFTVTMPLTGHFINFISGWSNRGPVIYGCSFANYSGTADPKANKAVMGYDFGAAIRASNTRKSTFDNFSNAVDIKSIYGNTGFLSIFDAAFSKNTIGGKHFGHADGQYTAQQLRCAARQRGQQHGRLRHRGKY